MQLTPMSGGASSDPRTWTPQILPLTLVWEDDATRGPEQAPPPLEPCVLRISPDQQRGRTLVADAMRRLSRRMAEQVDREILLLGHPPFDTMPEPDVVVEGRP